MNLRYSRAAARQWQKCNLGQRRARLRFLHHRGFGVARNNRSQNIAQRGKPGLEIPPLFHAIAENGPANLLGTRGAHGAVVLIEAQAGGLERETAIVEQPANLLVSGSATMCS